MVLGSASSWMTSKRRQPGSSSREPRPSSSAPLRMRSRYSGFIRTVTKSALMACSLSWWWWDRSLRGRGELARVPDGEVVEEAAGVEGRVVAGGDGEAPVDAQGVGVAVLDGGGGGELGDLGRAVAGLVDEEDLAVGGEVEPVAVAGGGGAGGAGGAEGEADASGAVGALWGEGDGGGPFVVVDVDQAGGEVGAAF